MLTICFRWRGCASSRSPRALFSVRLHGVTAELLTEGGQDTGRGREGMRSMTAGAGGSEGFSDPITQSLLDQGPAAASAAYERYQNVASTRREAAQTAREQQNEL